MEAAVGDITKEQARELFAGEVGNFIEEKTKDLAAKIEESRKEIEELTRQASKAANRPLNEGVVTDTKFLHRGIDGQFAPATKANLGHRGARFVRNFINAGKDLDAALAMARKQNDAEMIAAFEKSIQEKNMSTGSHAAGGSFVPEEFAREFIELLETRTVVRAMGALSLPLANGNLTIPKQTGPAEAYWVGEAPGSVDPSQPSTGSVQLSAKKLAALIPISEELRQFSDPRVDAMVSNEIVNRLRLGEDAAYLRSHGSQHKPRGVLSLAAHREDANATVNLDNVTQDLALIVRLVHESETLGTNFGFIFNHRTHWFLRAQRDGNGNLAWPELAQGRLLGFPVMVTGQIPSDLNSNESEIYFGDWAQFVIGDAGGLELREYTGGAIADGSAIRSGISEGFDVMRGTLKVDANVRHADAFAVLEEVTWGAS